jgi:DNA-binding MarR family transcriptional regulator
MSMPRSNQLRGEIRQRRPFRNVFQEGTIGLLRTADLVRSGFEHLFEPYGLTLQQYNVLRILRGSHPEALPTMEIAVRMIECAPGITRLLDRLETKGLVVRKRCPEDRRRVLCSITEPALDLLANLDAEVDRADREALGGLAESEVKELNALLDRVRANRG